MGSISVAVGRNAIQSDRPLFRPFPTSYPKAYSLPQPEAFPSLPRLIVIAITELRGEAGLEWPSCVIRITDETCRAGRMGEIQEE